MEKEKIENKEDEIVICNMNVDGFKWYDKRGKDEKKKRKILNITVKERKAIAKGILSAYYKVVFCVIIGFAFVFLIISLWLKIL